MYTKRIVSVFWSFLKHVSYQIVSDCGGLGIVSDAIVSDLFEYRIVSIVLVSINFQVSYRVVSFFGYRIVSFFK